MTRGKVLRHPFRPPRLVALRHSLPIEDADDGILGSVILWRLVSRILFADVLKHDLLEFFRPIPVVFFRHFVELRDEFVSRPDIHHRFHPLSITVKPMYSKKIQNGKQ